MPFANLIADPINHVVYPNSKYSINFAGISLNGILFNIMKGSVRIDINAQEYWRDNSSVF